MRPCARRSRGAGIAGLGCNLRRAIGVRLDGFVWGRRFRPRVAGEHIKLPFLMHGVQHPPEKKIGGDYWELAKENFFDFSRNKYLRFGMRPD